MKSMIVEASSWYGAYVAVLLVSALPNLLLFLIPTQLLTAKGNKNSINYQNLMLSFAAAGLLGDVFLHTLPHLIAPHSHNHDHDGHFHGMESHNHEHDGHDHHDHDQHEHEHEHELHDHNHHDQTTHEMFAAHAHDEHHEHSGVYDFIGLERSTIIGLVLLLGFIVFMFAEKLASGHSYHHHNHDHCDKHSDDEGEHIHTTESTHSSNSAGSNSNNTTRRSTRLQEKSNKSDSPMSPISPTTSNNNEKPSISLFSAMQTQLHTSGWLNLLADTMHNFTDGIALGASFASGKGLAYATFLSIIFHEIPHEIGDFAILIQSGLTKTQAIQAQFMTAIAAVLGTSIGLLAQRSQIWEELLLSFTAGGFLYLATVNILPSIVRTADHNNSSSGSSIMQSLLELVCFVLGIVMMVFVTFLE